MAEVQPDSAETRGLLERVAQGDRQALAGQGRFAEALDCRKRCHELGSRRPDWPSAKAEQASREVERLATLDARLAKALGGEAGPPSAAEAVELAQFCQHRFKQHHATAARLYAAAFADEPKLAEVRNLPHRYNAACAAALAGTGQGCGDGLELADPTL